MTWVFQVGSNLWFRFWKLGRARCPGDHHLPRDSCATSGIRLSPLFPPEAPTMGIERRPLQQPLLPSQSKGLREPLRGWPAPGSPVLLDSTATPRLAALELGFRPQAWPGSGRSRLREAPPPARPRPGVQIRCGRAAGDAGGSRAEAAAAGAASAPRARS